MSEHDDFSSRFRIRLLVFLSYLSLYVTRLSLAFSTPRGEAIINFHQSVGHLRADVEVGGP
jgi:hypothetical protein